MDQFLVICVALPKRPLHMCQSVLLFAQNWNKFRALGAQPPYDKHGLNSWKSSHGHELLSDTKFVGSAEMSPLWKGQLKICPLGSQNSIISKLGW